jgi:hypothetical protein
MNNFLIEINTLTQMATYLDFSNIPESRWMDLIDQGLDINR